MVMIHTNGRWEEKPPEVWCGYLFKEDYNVWRCYSVQEYESMRLEEKKEYILKEERCYNNFYCYWSWKISIVLIFISVFLLFFLDRMNDKELTITMLIIILTLIMIFIYWYFYI